MLAVEIIFWSSLAALFYSLIGYPLLLALLVRLFPNRSQAGGLADLPRVSLIIACHNEQQVIASKIENTQQLDYPSSLLEIIVASDGSSDRTAAIANELAATDSRIKVLDLPRGGKVRAQDAAAEVAEGEFLAFSDANSYWHPSALKQLLGPFAEPEVGYVCGKVTFVEPDGSNQEGLYWRYELMLRGLESRFASVTAGNGAIYATRKESYQTADPRMGHDLSLPYRMVKAGWRALFQPSARAVEKMVPSLEGEFRRKRRMMAHTWLILLTGGILNPLGYGFRYSLEIFSHRLLRYLAPFIHLLLLASSIILALSSAAVFYWLIVALQAAVLLATLNGLITGSARRFVALPYYYLAMNAAIALGLWDFLRRGVEAHWQQAEGTR